MTYKEANIVVIGGGILGTSIAYHLAKSGAKDVLLLEKAQLTHGSTWHAAGMVGQLRSSKNISSMLKRSVEIYQGLEAETGLASGWRRTGSLRLASNAERMRELRRSKTMADGFGLEAEILTPNEARALFPILNTDGLEGALHIVNDGVADPTSLTHSFAAGARKHGAEIEQGIRVTGFERTGNRIVAVQTDRGRIACQTVVNAGGVWARDIGKLMGVSLACCGLEHQYMVTENVPEIDASMPSVRDPDLSIYYKPESNGLVVGAWEKNTGVFDRAGVPADFGQELLGPQMDRLETYLQSAMYRTPVLQRLGLRDHVNGPIPFSADGDFVMGPIPDLANAYVAAGCVVGIAAGGGIGEVMAEWILTGRPRFELWPLDVRRFGAHSATDDYLYPRAIEVYANHYLLQPPGYEATEARNLRLSPLYSRLKDLGAVYGSKFGWERANLFWTAEDGADGTDAAEVQRPSHFCPGWFDHVGKEHRTIREGAALLDLTSFAKYQITGPDALAVLQHLSVRDMDVPAGRAVYTQLCNANGGIEADVTIARLADDVFYYVTGTGNGVRDMDFIRRNAPQGADFHIADVTSANAVILLTGPKSPDVLKELLSASAVEAISGFGTISDIAIGAATLKAMRVNFTGEMGWELHIPSEFAVHVFDLLMAAGERHGLRNCGYRALESLRIEMGFRFWGSDITSDYTPYEAGLGFCVDLDKGPFLARAALVAAKAAGPARRLHTFTVDDYVQLVGGETLYRNGQIAATTTSGAFSYTTQKSVCLAYVPADIAEGDTFEIEAYGARYPAALRTNRNLLKCFEINLDQQFISKHPPH